MTQLRTRPVEGLESGALPRTGKWILWLAGLALLTGITFLVWVALSTPTAMETPFQENFTGVDDFVYDRVHSTVIETPFQEDFTGVNDHVAERVRTMVVEAPPQEDFTGVDEFVSERVRSRVVVTPFQEDFTGLD